LPKLNCRAERVDHASLGGLSSISSEQEPGTAYDEYFPPWPHVRFNRKAVYDASTLAKAQSPLMRVVGNALAMLILVG